jgi:hypothetical protein
MIGSDRPRIRGRQEQRVAALQDPLIWNVSESPGFPDVTPTSPAFSAVTGQHQVIASVTAKLSRNISLRSEYGRAAYDNRYRGFISASVNLPFRIRSAPSAWPDSANAG